MAAAILPGMGAGSSPGSHALRMKSNTSRCTALSVPGVSDMTISPCSALRRRGRLGRGSAGIRPAEMADVGCQCGDAGNDQETTMLMTVRLGAALLSLAGAMAPLSASEAQESLAFEPYAFETQQHGTIAGENGCRQILMGSQ